MITLTGAAVAADHARFDRDLAIGHSAGHVRTCVSSVRDKLVGSTHHGDFHGD